MNALELSAIKGEDTDMQPWEDSLSEREETKSFGPGNAVYLLLLLATVNQWARALIFYTVDFKAAPSDETIRLFMNVDVGFDQAQYGLLASIGFAALFSMTSFIAGGLVDRVNTRNLLTGTSALWSGATVAQGMAHSFPEVLTARIATSFGQGFTNPASYTILGRLYPSEQRATVNGLYAASVYFGGGLAALSVVLDEQLGWRGLYLGIGALGLVATGVVQLALPPLPPPLAPQGKSLSPPADARAVTSKESAALLSSASEDDEGMGAATGQDADDAVSGGSKGDASDEGVLLGTPGALKELVAVPTVRLLLLASTLRFLAGFTVGVWIVPFYREAFPGAIGAEFALIKAAVNGVAGSLSATGGGVLSDRLGTKDPRFALWVPAAGSVLAIPCWIATLNAPTLELSLGALFLEYLLAECWFGPTVAGLQDAAPPRAQGLTTGIFSALTFVGNLAPFFIGLAIKGDNADLTTLLAYSVSVLYAASAIVFVAASQTAPASQTGEK